MEMIEELVNIKTDQQKLSNLKNRMRKKFKKNEEHQGTIGQSQNF